MKVYRIALPPTHELNATGQYQGPYMGHRYGEISRLASDMNYNHSDDRHPSPWCDHTTDGTVLNIDSWEFCVFSSVEQMAEWFDGYGMKLDEVGFVVAVYEVETHLVREGRYQSVCPLEQSWIVEVLSPAGMIE